LTLEPVILLSVVLLRLGGLNYALFVVIVPLLMADILSAHFSFDTLISIFCKVLVLINVSLFQDFNLFTVTIISYLIFNEGIGTILSIKAGTPIDKILTQLLTSTLIRIFYLSIFLEPLLKIFS
jgi:hypothetical protein